MTPAEAIALTILHIAAWLIPCIALAAVAVWVHERRQARAWNRDTETAIVQAVALVDDEKALVREAEDYLKGRHHA